MTTIMTTIMGYSQHEFSTINMLYSLKKIVPNTPLPPQNGHLSTTATFDCIELQYYTDPAHSQ